MPGGLSTEPRLATPSWRAQRVEAGAQGEHKLQRGYLPVPTYSSHWVEDGGFRGLVANFLAEEGRDMEHTREALRLQASPYKKDAA